MSLKEVVEKIYQNKLIRFIKVRAKRFYLCNFRCEHIQENEEGQQYCQKLDRPETCPGPLRRSYASKEKVIEDERYPNKKFYQCYKGK